MRITPQEIQARLHATRAEAECLASKMADHVEGELLVKLPEEADVAELGQDYGATVLETIRFSGEMAKSFNGKLVHLQLPEGLSTAEGIALFEKDSRVVYAEANDLVERQATPDDLDPQLWGLKKIEAEAAWDVAKGSRTGPIVAVIDSGIDTGHPDLRANLWANPREVADGRDNDGNDVVDDLHGYNAINGSGNPHDDNNHGTHCSGTIAGVGNNGQGVVGVNWEGRLLGAKFLGANGKGAISNAVKAVGYASEQGARIQNHSWGHTGGWGNRALEDAMRSSPSLHICAAGNDGQDTDYQPHYPSSFALDNMVSVAATDRSDHLADFSNHGAASVDLAAPGVGIYSTVPGGGYQSMSGTSMATPHVAGVAALIATAHPGLSNAQLKTRLMASVDVLPQLSGTSLTGGRLNARKAVETDRVAPGTPGGFQATARPSGEVTLSWVATGDDAAAGRASSYQLRSSTSPIDEGNFARAAIMRTGAPAESGQTESRQSLAFPASQDRVMHFGLKAVDNVGNSSPLVRASVVIPGTRVVLDDDMDGSSRWSGEGWGRVSVEGRGKVWTDSPRGEYENGANRSLVSPRLDLSGVTGAAVTFDYRHDLENRFDKVTLEASTDGQSWTSLREFTGKKMWERARVDLSAYDGQSLQLRFRLSTDNAVTKDGFSLDRLVVAGSQRRS